MAKRKIKRVITGNTNYLNKEQKHQIETVIPLYKEISQKNWKTHYIAKNHYMIELIDVPEELKEQIKKDIKPICCTIYKTNQTLKELRDKQKAKLEIKQLAEA